VSGTFILGGSTYRTATLAVSQGGLDGSSSGCRLWNVDREERWPSCRAAVLRWVIRMGQSCFITRSITEGSTTLKGDTEVEVS